MKIQLHKTTSHKKKATEYNTLFEHTYIVLYQANENDTAVVHGDACTCFW